MDKLILFAMVSTDEFKKGSLQRRALFLFRPPGDPRELSSWREVWVYGPRLFMALSGLVSDNTLMAISESADANTPKLPDQKRFEEADRKDTTLAMVCEDEGITILSSGFKVYGLAAVREAVQMYGLDDFTNVKPDVALGRRQVMSQINGVYNLLTKALAMPQRQQPSRGFPSPISTKKRKVTDPYVGGGYSGGYSGDYSGEGKGEKPVSKKLRPSEIRGIAKWYEDEDINLLVDDLIAHPFGSTEEETKSDAGRKQTFREQVHLLNASAGALQMVMLKFQYLLAYVQRLRMFGALKCLCPTFTTHQDFATVNPLVDDVLMHNYDEAVWKTVITNTVLDTGARARAEREHKAELTSPVRHIMLKVFHHNDHWTLLVGDSGTRTFYYWDANRKDTPVDSKVDLYLWTTEQIRRADFTKDLLNRINISALLAVIREFCARVSEDGRQWQLKVNHLKLQADGYSCGPLAFYGCRAFKSWVYHGMSTEPEFANVWNDNYTGDGYPINPDATSLRGQMEFFYRLDEPTLTPEVNQERRKNNLEQAKNMYDRQWEHLQRLAVVSETITKAATTLIHARQEVLLEGKWFKGRDGYAAAKRKLEDAIQQRIQQQLTGSKSSSQKGRSPAQEQIANDEAMARQMQREVQPHLATDEEFARQLAKRWGGR